MDTHARKRNHPVRRALAAGAVVAATAAAASYYFYGSEDAKKHRQRAARWALSFKRDVLKHIAKAKKLDRATVVSAVDSAARSLGKITAQKGADVEKLARELKRHWHKLAAEAVKATKKGATRMEKRPARKRGA